MNGYILLRRKVQRSDLYPSQERRPFTRYEAWLDLIFMAAFEAHTVYYLGAALEIDQGELIASQRWLSKRWRWSPARVRRFLSYLIDSERITASRVVSHRDTGDDTTPDSVSVTPLGRIKLLNYQALQDPRLDERHYRRHHPLQRKRHPNKKKVVYNELEKEASRQAHDEIERAIEYGFGAYWKKRGNRLDTFYALPVNEQREIVARYMSDELEGIIDE